jgi:hypothetical protein
MRRAGVVVLFTLLCACENGPGRTPVDQEPLAVVDQAVAVEPRLLVAGDVSGRGTLIDVLAEFKRTPLRLHVVWVRPEPPGSRELAKYPSRQVKQYWDSKALSGKADGLVEYRGRKVPLKSGPLRVIFARATAEPQ